MLLRQIILLLLLVGCAVQLPSQVTITAEEMNPDTARQYMLAANELEGDSAMVLLEKAFKISEETSFDAGVRMTSERLILMYQTAKNVTSELRTRLNYANYLELQGDTATHAEALYQIGLLYLEQKIYPKAADAFLRVIGLTESNNSDLGFQALKRYAWALHQEQKWREAKANYLIAYETAAAKGRFKDQLWIQQQLARIAHARKRYSEEVSVNREVLRLAQRARDEQSALIALNNMGFAAKFMGKLDSAAAYFEEVVRRVDKLQPPDPVLKSEVLLNLGVIAQNKNDFPEAKERFQQAARSAQSAGQTRTETIAYNYLARTYLQFGDSYNARFFNDQTLRSARKNQHPDLLLDGYSTRALIYESLYDFEKALKAKEDFLALRDSLKNEEDNRARILAQEQYLMDRIEKEMDLLKVDREIKDLEIENLKSEQAREEEAKKRIAKELELQVVQSQNDSLDAARARAALSLSESQRLQDLQEAEIFSLEKEQEIRELELDRQKGLARESETRALSLQQENRIQTLELESAERQADQERLRNRNLVYTIGGLGLLVLIILIVLLQLRRKNSKIRRQQVLIAEEKEKSDDLLLNILPLTVATELKENGSSPPRLYEEVSVVFTDFSGFTMISEQLSPAQLVEKLDAIFLEFDLIVERNGLQRIKTIGDAYMCACGLPEPDPKHAQRAALAALEMRNFIRNFNRQLPAGQPPWNIRIGIHSGPVVAGVVGIRKFAYDIWGDAVNTASRMESSGVVDKVNVSGATRELLGGIFELEYRGKIAAKNKGEVDMYFVERKN